MSARQDQVVDAAIRVLGQQGLRQLTHRAVDAEAGLPAGSTSNYARTRDALLRAVVVRLGVLDRADWHELADADRPGDAPELAEALAGFVRFATGPGRVRTMARYALCLEAAVRPELQAELRAGNAEILRWALPWLRGAGSPDPAGQARLVLDYLDGVILHQLAFPDPEFDPTPNLGNLLHALLPTP